MIGETDPCPICGREMGSFRPDGHHAMMRHMAIKYANTADREMMYYDRWLVAMAALDNLAVLCKYMDAKVVREIQKARERMGEIHL